MKITVILLLSLFQFNKANSLNDSTMKFSVWGVAHTIPKINNLDNTLTKTNVACGFECSSQFRSSLFENIGLFRFSQFNKKLDTLTYSINSMSMAIQIGYPLNRCRNICFGLGLNIEYLNLNITNNKIKLLQRFGNNSTINNSNNFSSVGFGYSVPVFLQLRFPKINFLYIRATYSLGLKVSKLDNGSIVRFNYYSISFRLPFTFESEIRKK